MSLITSQGEISSIVNEDIQAKINFFHVNSWDLTHSKQLANNNNNYCYITSVTQGKSDIFCKTTTLLQPPLQRSWPCSGRPYTS